MKRRNSGKGAVAIIVALLILAGACAAGLAIVKSGFVTKSGKAARGGPTTLLPIGEIVVNLADTDAVRYLKVDVVLEVRGEVDSGGEQGTDGTGDVKTPVRDAVIGVLSSKRFAELLKPEGKDKLKTELLEAVNQRMQGTEAVEVYFNEFAMQ